MIQWYDGPKPNLITQLYNTEPIDIIYGFNVYRSERDCQIAQIMDFARRLLDND